TRVTRSLGWRRRSVGVSMIWTPCSSRRWSSPSAGDGAGRAEGFPRSDPEGVARDSGEVGAAAGSAAGRRRTDTRRGAGTAAAATSGRAVADEEERAGPDWAGPGWAGPGWAGPDWAGPDCGVEGPAGVGGPAACAALMGVTSSRSVSAWS